jgi:hypothetical protein
LRWRGSLPGVFELPLLQALQGRGIVRGVRGADADQPAGDAAGAVGNDRHWPCYHPATNERSAGFCRAASEDGAMGQTPKNVIEPPAVRVDTCSIAARMVWGSLTFMRAHHVSP